MRFPCGRGSKHNLSVGHAGEDLTIVQKRTSSLLTFQSISTFAFTKPETPLVGYKIVFIGL